MSTLYRIDNNTWSYTSSSTPNEIRCSIANASIGPDTFRVAQTVQNIFDNNQAFLSKHQLKKGIVLHIQDPSIGGEWLVTSRKTQCIFFCILLSIIDWITQWFSTQMIQSKRVINVCVKNIHRHPCEKLTAKIRGATHLENVIPSQGLPETAKKIPFKQTFDNLISMQDFEDPFTKLSSLCLQTIEPAFVLEAKTQGSYRIVLRGDYLYLEKIDAINDAIREENRTTVQAFVKFITLEYGLAFVSQLQISFNLNFDEMVKNGEPLVPDIVFKSNVGVNSVEMEHVEDLWKTLKECQELLHNAPLENHNPFFILHGKLSLRVIRKLCEGRPTRAEVTQFLDDLIGKNPPTKASDLTEKPFNTIVAFLTPTDEELERSFTGRKICHVAISGGHSMGEPNTPNAARDFFELEQIYRDLRIPHHKKKFPEVAGYVLPKKNMFRENPSQRGDRWHVGLLIPGPDSLSGEKRWFYVAQFIDDGDGNVNYVLLPACKGLTSQPMFKIYRSTCPGRDQENWLDSILADVYPFGSPGTTKQKESYLYEAPFFEKRTIPLWVAKHACAKKYKEENFHDDYIAELKKTVTQLGRYLEKNYPLSKTEILIPINHVISEEKWDALDKILESIAERYQERICDKIAEDIVFSGHSLGGGLAQFATYYFTAHQERMPLPSHRCDCFDYNGPAIDTEQDREFMKFFRENKKTLEDLKIGIGVHHQFACKDYVPEGGQSHLATTDYNESTDTWLQFKANVYKSLKTATALTITSFGPHERRYSTAVEGKDYTKTHISSKDLHTFDHAKILHGRIARIFGEHFFISPWASEAIRRIGGSIVYFPLKAVDFFIGNRIGSRDSSGIMSVTYG